MFCLHLYKFWIYDEKKKHDLKECKNIMEKRKYFREKSENIKASNMKVSQSHTKISHYL